jgi:hypothetical protein
VRAGTWFERVCSCPAEESEDRKNIGEEVVVAGQMEFSPFELRIQKSGFVDGVEEVGMAIVGHLQPSRGLSPASTTRPRFFVHSKTSRHAGFSYDAGSCRSPSDFEDENLRKNLPRFLRGERPEESQGSREAKGCRRKCNATSKVALA